VLRIWPIIYRDALELAHRQNHSLDEFGVNAFVTAKSADQQSRARSYRG